MKGYITVGTRAGRTRASPAARLKMRSNAESVRSWRRTETIGDARAVASLNTLTTRKARSSVWDGQRPHQEQNVTVLLLQERLDRILRRGSPTPSRRGQSRGSSPLSLVEDSGDPHGLLRPRHNTS
jgi:hypothetical protein